MVSGMDIVSGGVVATDNKNVSITKAENGFVVNIGWREAKALPTPESYQEYDYKNKMFIFTTLVEAVDTITIELG